MSTRWTVVLLLGLGCLLPASGRAQVNDELDAFWAEMSRTVAEGDFEGYGRLYHPDAVLVSLGKETSIPIAAALDRWKPGFDDTRAGKAEAGVAFRITRRLAGNAASHETGIFRYTMKPEGEPETVALVHFEGLLIKQDGAWQLMMEYQKERASEEEWEEAAR